MTRSDSGAPRYAYERLNDALIEMRNVQLLKAIKAQQLFTGMTQSEVIRSLGHPKSRARVTFPPEARERFETVWTYRSGYTVSFGYDGLVAAFSDELQFKP